MDYVRETVVAWEKLQRRQFVAINEGNLFRVAAKKAVMNKLKLPHWVEKGVLPQDARAFASQIFMYNTMNFCYTDPSGKQKETFTVRYGRREFKGAMALAACFHRAFGERRILAKDVLPHVKTIRSFARFLEGENRIPLIEERRLLLTETLEILNAFFDGDPLNVFEAGGFRAFAASSTQPGIVDILTKRFPLAFGQDVAEIDGQKFYFFKRPQLLVLEYHGRVSHRSDGLPPISDIGALGAICDYELPKTFIADGILQLRGDLQARIRNRDPLQPGSREETEIRAATYWAMMKEVQIINEARRKLALPLVHTGHVDYQRWTRGHKLPEAHMLVATTNY